MLINITQIYKNYYEQDKYLIYLLYKRTKK